MPTTIRTQAISTDEAVHRAGRRAFTPAGDHTQPGRIGLEQELIPVSIDPRGRPAGRVPLEGEGGVLSVVDALAASDRELRLEEPHSGQGEYLLHTGGRLTFEPGGQIEYSTSVHPTAAMALDDVSRVQSSMQNAFCRFGAVLAATGVDLWHDVMDVPLQLRAGRYTTMSRFFDQRGPWGRVMMRHTASLQVNLDLGREGVWQERWQLANLLAPYVLATFAASPGSEGVSTRALAWQRLDPTRTGFPAQMVDGPGDDPANEWSRAALDADVMIVRSADGGFATGRPGRSFGEWIEHGDAEHGWPTVEDLDYHLTTLFFEVRPRGFLELRSCESLPDVWRPAPVVLITALLYDDRARHDALALLEGSRSRLPRLWARAAREGIRHPEIASRVGRLWELALAGAGRMSSGYLGANALAATYGFLERFTFAGRMPADDLEGLSADPRDAVAWAAGCQDRALSDIPTASTTDSAAALQDSWQQHSSVRNAPRSRTASRSAE